MKRIESIDIVRGIVMIVMALDHVRDLFHFPIGANPTDLNTTTPAIFFTRFITHFCAPTFVFLAGTSAFLSLRKSGDVRANQSFLLKRGLWLILLEFTVVTFGIWFDIGFHTFLFQVIAAIGFGFILLGLCLKLSPKTIGIIGLVLLLIQTILPILPVTDGALKTSVSLLFFPNFIPIGTRAIVYAYPILSWTAILFLGFGFGNLFLKRKYESLLLGFGSACLALFVTLRYFNIGDISPWSMQKDLVFTAMSFLNVTKYPPTLLFCLLTLGVMFLLLWLSEKTKSKVTEIFKTYGKVPMFYYLIHWYTIHVSLVILLLAQGFSFDQMDFSGMRFGHPMQVKSGVSLTWVYLIWIGIVALLYFPVKWYARYKSAHAKSWLRYL
ncbi:heparan-alpha-glucosaminide N-acetyltransferase domain-containing protein [Flavobacterium sp.]|uniref:DUF1624 domain-containing protein n=1 Tax=Flavobacterium sp. TaxID=239 RepID=UPI00121BC630|nr:heparan-alpha-glucosaminide N-acetyltransferase domain-containing protein [Flavobacterium sp.]RZJ73089.1 MAG: DUF1624 domain-containing protein [Flavobacterium sp.]